MDRNQDDALVQLEACDALRDLAVNNMDTERGTLPTTPRRSSSILVSSSPVHCCAALSPSKLHTDLHSTTPSLCLTNEAYAFGSSDTSTSTLCESSCTCLTWTVGKTQVAVE
jgi:hypothetical protein